MILYFDNTSKHTQKILKILKSDQFYPRTKNRDWIKLELREILR